MGKKKEKLKSIKVFVLIIAAALVLVFVVFFISSIDSLSKAEKLANQYQYEDAIELLKKKNKFLCSVRISKRIAAYEDTLAQIEASIDASPVPHIFFHSLIADPVRAFNSESANSYNQDMVTISEFNEILTQLYENNYVLVREHDIAEETADGFVQRHPHLPKGKRPLIISQDDVNYGKSMAEDGFTSRLVVKDDRVMCEMIDQNGEVQTGAFDLVPILDDFISEHPDFSYQGARAVIAVTGAEGVFGYHNVVHPDSPAYNSECEAARAVADKLREEGYELASHSYAHVHTGTITQAELQQDVKLWDKYIGSLIGKTDIYIYPYGEDLTQALKNTSSADRIMERDIYLELENFQPLYDAGFRYFLNVDSTSPAWVQYNQNYVRQARRNIDGYRLTYPSSYLYDLFYDLDKIYYPYRPYLSNEYVQ